MSEVLEGHFRAAVDQVMPMVPDLASRRTRGLRASALEKNPDAIQSELIASLNEQGIDTKRPEVQTGLPKMECYAMLGAVNLQLYPVIVDGHGSAAQFRPEFTGSLEHSPDFRVVAAPVFQNGFYLLGNENRWVRTVEDHYPVANDTYINPVGMSEMQMRKPPRQLREEVNGGDLGMTVPELVKLARKLELREGRRLPEDASDDFTEAWLLQRRKTVETYLTHLAMSRSSINIGQFTNQKSNNLEISDLEGAIETFETSRGHTRTQFRRDNAENMRLVFPNNEELKDGPTLKCPFRHGDTVSSTKNTLEGYLFAGIDLAYNMGAFLRINDVRAIDGFPDLDPIAAPYA